MRLDQFDAIMDYGVHTKRQYTRMIDRDESVRRGSQLRGESNAGCSITRAVRPAVRDTSPLTTASEAPETADQLRDAVRGGRWAKIPAWCVVVQVDHGNVIVHQGERENMEAFVKTVEALRDGRSPRSAHQEFIWQYVLQPARGSTPVDVMSHARAMSIGATEMTA
jgi:hypothetical protein